MSATLTTPPRAAPVDRQRQRRPRRVACRRNWLGGLAGWLWLAIVVIPLYWILITSFKAQSSYYTTNPLVPPADPMLGNYRMVIDSDFIGYFINSVVVTAGAVIPAVTVSFMAAYAIVRGWSGRFLRAVNGLFLMGLAIPLQATIIPIYLIIIRLHLYDSLLALILPSIAFAIPLSVLVLATFIRDVPKELFESMRIDGATDWTTLWRLTAPLTRPAILTVTVYNALTIWNGFLLPLVLTQSPDRRTLPLALWTVRQGGVIPGPVQCQRTRRGRLRRAHHTPHPGPVRGRPPPTSQRPDRRLQPMRSSGWSSSVWPGGGGR